MRLRPAKKTRKAIKRATKRARRGYVRPDASPYTLKPRLQREVIEKLAKLIDQQGPKLNTDRYTLLEIVDRLLRRYIRVPRPASLRAHMVFSMFVRPGGRIRSGVSTECHEWRGSYRAGFPVVTTVNSQSGERLMVDARKHIILNPPNGKRRNLRTIPENKCGNERCVNPKHITMVLSNPLSHQGENHPRSKFTDKDIVRMVKEYNAGATAKQISKKWGMILPYVEQIMRKEKRTEATAGLRIRGRFGYR
ncbi:MAG: hypothetical protein U1F16_11985 [Turneriella sp.]